MSRPGASAGPHPASIILLDYLEGGLPTPVLDDVRRHLTRCRDCRRQLTDICGAVEEIERLPSTEHVGARDDPPRCTPIDRAEGRIRKVRLAAVGTLLAVAAAVGTIATQLRVEPRAGAATSGERALSTTAGALGGEVVRDASDARRLVLVVPDASRAPAEAAARDAARAGLRVSVAVYAR